MINPMDILDAREKRSYLQEKLIKKFNLPILVIRANYPGIDKNNKTTKFIVETLYHELLLKFSYTNLEKIDSFEGLIYILSFEISPSDLKKIAIEMETSHPLGRLVDIDILNLQNHTLSRTDLGYAPRKCFICSSLAHNCVRSKKHSLEEVLKYIENKILYYKEHHILNLTEPSNKIKGV